MQRLARAVQLAAEIRENSFDHEKADSLEKSDLLIKDFESCYGISLVEAADEAAGKSGFDERGTQPIYLLLKYTWNDILDWANKNNLK